jgi:hypothetical protein
MSTPDVPEPTGATQVSDWHKISNGAFRYFTGQRWLVEVYGADYDVHITGNQFADGRVARAVVLAPPVSNTGPLNVSQARKLARLLMAACDEIEWLDSIDDSGRNR